MCVCCVLRCRGLVADYAHAVSACMIIMACACALMSAAAAQLGCTAAGTAPRLGCLHPATASCCIDVVAPTTARGLTCPLSARVSCVPQLEAFKQFHEQSLDELAVAVTARINAYESEIKAQQDKLSSYRHKLSTYQHQCDVYPEEIRAYKNRAVSYQQVSEQLFLMAVVGCCLPSSNRGD